MFTEISSQIPQTINLRLQAHFILRLLGLFVLAVQISFVGMELAFMFGYIFFKGRASDTEFDCENVHIRNSNAKLKCKMYCFVSRVYSNIQE